MREGPQRTLPRNKVKGEPPDEWARVWKETTSLKSDVPGFEWAESLRDFRANVSPRS